MATQGPATPDGLLAAAKKPCVVVAHPDDETLWAGGLIVRYPDKWTVICCTVPVNDPERIDKFANACAVLGARPVALKQNERQKITVPDLSEYDLVVTHGPNGEYGHPQHMELHSKIKPAVWFAYGGKADFTIELTESEWQRKLSALKCYDGKSPVDKNRPLWETLLEYFGNRFDVRREPYGAV